MFQIKRLKNQGQIVKIGRNDNLLSPLPVVLVGTIVNNQPNFLVIGYITPFDFGKYIFFSLYKKRYSSQGIHEQLTFSVNIPSVSLLKETLVCGSKSGYNFVKSKLFDVSYDELKTAPMIDQCPISIECQVNEILNYDQNEGIIGRVVKSYIHQDYLRNGKLDMRLVNPIIWSTGGDYNYYQLGNRIKHDH